MEYVKLGRTGLDVSRICLGCMSYGVPERGTHPWTLDEEQSRPFIKQALEPGINFFDTANVYSDGTSEEIVGRALKDFARRDEVVIATKVHGRMRPGPERRRPVAQGDHGRDRRQPAAARHRLRRPLPDPSLGLRHADRGDAGGAARRREGRQGALHRRLVDVCLAVRQGAAPRRAARLDALRLDAEPLQPALPRGGARDAAALRGRGHRRDPVEPAGARPADPRLGRARTARSETDEFGKTLYANTAEADRKVVEAVAAVAAARGVPRAQVALAWVLQKKPVVTAPIVGATKLAASRRRRGGAVAEAHGRTRSPRSRSPTFRTGSPATRDDAGGPGAARRHARYRSSTFCNVTWLLLRTSRMPRVLVLLGETTVRQA